MEEQLTNRNSRIVVLENKLEKQYIGFSELLQQEQEKVKLRTEMLDHANKIADSHLQENKDLKKKVRGLKWQRAGLGILTVVVIGLSL